MTNLQSMYDEYRLAVKPFKPSVPLSDEDYFTIFKSGLRRLFNATGRRASYIPSECQSASSNITPTLENDEEEYVVLASQIAFFRQMEADAIATTRITQHKTDALTVVFSDKGPVNLAAMIQALEAQLLYLFHGMPRFSEGKA